MLVLMEEFARYNSIFDFMHESKHQRWYKETFKKDWDEDTWDFDISDEEILRPYFESLPYNYIFTYDEKSEQFIIYSI